jgi:hypothetical protein
MAMTRGFIFIVAVFAWLLCEVTVVAQGSGRGGMGGGRDNSSDSGHQNASPNYGRRKSPPSDLTPHGGEYFKSETNCYEIVFLPLQARIYLFDHDQKPLSAKDVHVQMSLSLPSANPPSKIPFQYVKLPPGTAEQDYVVAAFDFRQLPVRPTPITFDFSGLPDRHKFLGIWDSHEGIASFTLMFSSAKIRPYVAKVPLTEADRDGIFRQRFCPVSGRMLGSNGTVVKLYIADYPLYLAREDCIAVVEQAPEKYLPQPATPIPGR